MFPDPQFIDSSGLRMAVYEQGEGPAVIMVHGFPELAYSWRHQLPAFAKAGFRAIAPDMRGYGRTGAPAGVDAYQMKNLIGDLQGLMDALDLERATFIGHDWGALVLWHMAMLAPDRIDPRETRRRLLHRQFSGFGRSRSRVRRRPYSLLQYDDAQEPGLAGAVRSAATAEESNEPAEGHGAHRVER